MWWHLPWPMVWHLYLSTSCLPDYSCTFHLFAHFSILFTLPLSQVSKLTRSWLLFFLIVSFDFYYPQIALCLHLSKLVSIYSCNSFHAIILTNLQFHKLPWVSIHFKSFTFTIKLTHNFNLINFIRNLKLNLMLSQQMTIVLSLT